MIKFVIGLIALVFMGLALYVYIGQEEVPKKHAAQPTAKAEVVTIEEKISVSVSEPKVINQRKPEVQKTHKIFTSNETIEDLTPEEVQEMEAGENESFETKIAEEFDQENQYTGKTYSISDYNGDDLSSSETEVEDEESPILGDWENAEKTVDSH